MSKMNPEIKAKWIEALRSGKYRQCRDQFTYGRAGFCCLGVLHHVVQNGEMEKDVGHTYNVAGLSYLNDPCDRNEFIRMNDDERLTFDQIADRIEKDY